jgi:hypothetical protein
MRIKKGDRFKDYVGNLGYVSYMDKDIIKLTFINKKPWTETWDREDFIAGIDGSRFHPQPKPPINRYNITDHLIEYQLNMIGLTIDDVKHEESWYDKYCLSPEQYEAFKSYAIPLLKKVFKFNKGKAESTFSWFDLGYGLSVKK